MLLRQTLLFLPAQVLGPIFQLISAFAWTHFLAPAEMGAFAMITAAQELSFTATLLWFSLYTVRYFDRAAGAETTRQFLGTETAVLLASTLATVAAFTMLPLGQGGPIQGSLLWATLAFSSTRSLVSHYAERSRTEGDALAYTVLQTSGPVAGFLIGLACVAVLPATAATVMWAYAIAQGGSIAFATLRLRMNPNPFDGTWAILRAAAVYGMPLFFGGLLVWVASNGVRFLIEWKEGLATVGLFTVGWALGLRTAQFASMLTTAAAFPMAVRRAREDGIDAGQAQLVTNGIVLLAILAPAVAGLYEIGQPLIQLIIAQPYREITIAILPLALLTGALRNFRVHFVNQVFLLREQPVIPVLNDGVDAVLTIIMGAAGLWLGGPIGCIYGVTLAAAIALASGTYLGWRSFRYYFPPADLIRIGMATAAMTFVVGRLGALPGWLSILWSIIVGAVTYTGVMAALYPGTAIKAAGLLHNRLLKAAGPKFAARFTHPSSPEPSTKP